MNQDTKTVFINGHTFVKIEGEAKCDWGVCVEGTTHMVLCDEPAIVVAPRPRMSICTKHAEGLADAYSQDGRKGRD